MRSVTDWFNEYGQSHSDPTNKLLHRICVPLIVLSIIGLLWSLPVPAVFVAISPWLNWATVVALLALIYYAVLSLSLAAGIAIAFAMLFAITNALTQLPWPLWLSGVAIFVIGWIGQFIGHSIERTRPSFFKDVQFLLIGPLWLVAGLYRRLGVPY